MPDRERIERYFDGAPRSSSTVERCGPFTVFVSNAPWPHYARPTIGSARITVADVRAVAERQRQLGQAVSIEWQHDVHPDLAETTTAAGLPTRLLPLLVHHPDEDGERFDVDGWTIDILRHDEPDMGRIRAVADLGWRQVDTAIGSVGARERDLEPLDGAAIAFNRLELAEGRRSMVVVRSEEDGPVAVGSHKPLGDVTEIVGVAVLPAFRRRGLAAALTAMLVADAYARGTGLVMLVAESDAVARIYSRIGFRRFGSAGVAESDG